MPNFLHRDDLCIVCMKPNGIKGTFLRYNNYEGRYCEACSINLWRCPDCERLFYRNPKTHMNPRHNISPKSNIVCDGWKTEKRRKAEKYYGFGKTLSS